MQTKQEPLFTMSTFVDHPNERTRKPRFYYIKSIDGETMIQATDDGKFVEVEHELQFDHPYVWNNKNEAKRIKQELKLKHHEVQLYPFSTKWWNNSH